jgi:hypothetical protein
MSRNILMWRGMSGVSIDVSRCQVRHHRVVELSTYRSEWVILWPVLVYVIPGRYQQTTLGSVISASEKRIPSRPRPELLMPPKGMESRR